MAYFSALVLAIGFALPVAILSAAQGQGKAAQAALEGMARQPEASGWIRTSMILALAFIESLVLFALLVVILLLNHLPKTDALLKLLSKG